MVAICKSIYVIYNTNSTHKFLPSGLFKYFCMGENDWRLMKPANRFPPHKSIWTNLMVRNCVKNLCDILRIYFYILQLYKKVLLIGLFKYFLTVIIAVGVLQWQSVSNSSSKFWDFIIFDRKANGFRMIFSLL